MFDAVFTAIIEQTLFCAGSDACSLSKIFGKMEKVKEQLQIEDYSVSQTTLDQVRLVGGLTVVTCSAPQTTLDQVKLLDLTDHTRSS